MLLLQRSSAVKWRRVKKCVYFQLGNKTVTCPTHLTSPGPFLFRIGTHTSLAIQLYIFPFIKPKSANYAINIAGDSSCTSSWLFEIRNLVPSDLLLGKRPVVYNANSCS